MKFHYEQYVIPVWNELVHEKHASARDAFMLGNLDKVLSS